LERVQLHPDLVLLARCRGRLVEREPFRSRRTALHRRSKLSLWGT